MRFLLIVRPEAEEDIREAFEWYEARQADLGLGFVQEIETVFQYIEQNPMTFRKIHKELRRAFPRRFPYAVYYLVKGASVIVKGVLHQRKRPSQWQIMSNM
jgi:plasmid stabilization system protein ParE